MARHVWSVLCYKGCIDKFSNQVSLLDVMEVLAISEDDAHQGERFLFPHSSQLVSFWVREHIDTPEKSLIRMFILTPSGDRLDPSTELTVDLMAEVRARTIFIMNVLPFNGSGEYQFVVEQKSESEDWYECARVPLFMQIAPVADVAELVENGVASNALKF